MNLNKDNDNMEGNEEIENVEDVEDVEEQDEENVDTDLDSDVDEENEVDYDDVDNDDNNGIIEEDDDDIDDIDDIDDGDNDLEDNDQETAVNKSNKNKSTRQKKVKPVTKTYTEYYSENDVDEDDSDNDEDDDGDYLQKFNKEINKQYIEAEHPECVFHNYNEISALSNVIRDKNNNIIDPLHKTLPFLTKYEKTRIIGQRAKQINSGSKPFINVPQHIIDGYIIAELELKQKKIPFIIRRPIPGGGSEYWSVKDLELI